MAVAAIAKGSDVASSEFLPGAYVTGVAKDEVVGGFGGESSTGKRTGDDGEEPAGSPAICQT